MYVPSLQSSSGAVSQGGAPVAHLCEVCKKQLPSRNKLFQHIKESGHAVLRQQQAAPQASGTRQGQGSHMESRGSATNSTNDRKRTKNKRK